MENGEDEHGNNQPPLRNPALHQMLIKEEREAEQKLELLCRTGDKIRTRVTKLTQYIQLIEKLLEYKDCSGEENPPS